MRLECQDLDRGLGLNLSTSQYVYRNIDREQISRKDKTTEGLEQILVSVVC